MELASRPWDYPGTRAPYSGVLQGGRYRALGASDAVGLERRHLVVAVGCNASPAVMQRKLRAGAVSGTAVFLRGTVTGFGIGHSAHVSRDGYVAATPMRAPSDQAEAVVAVLLDTEQLECLDRTEPNYERVLVPATMCPLDLEAGPRPDGFSVYLSRWGALRDAGGGHLALTTQGAVFDWLRSRCPGVEQLLGRGLDLPATMGALAADPALRLHVRDLLSANGCAGPTGFETLRRRT